MSQHDFDIANQGFAAFRTDLNNALQALGSLSSGTTAPATTYANQLWYETDTNTLWLRNEANSAWLNVMVIDQSTGSPSFTAGNVGIGTSSPAGRLDVRGGTIEFDPASGADATRAFNFNIDGSNYAKLLVPSGGGGALAIYTGTAGSAAERMRIGPTGSVGIGTSSPTGKLQVAGGNVTINDSATNTALYFSRAEGTLASPTQITAAAILAVQVFSGLDNTSTYRDVAQIRVVTDGAITSTSSPGYLAFRTTPSGTVATAEAMRITSAGLVGIGTTLPPSQLTVSGAGQLVSGLTDAGAKTGTMQIHSTSGTSGAGGALLFSAAASNGATSQWAIKSLLIDGTANGLGDLVISGRTATADTALTERIRIAYSGTVMITNLAGAGSRTVTAGATGILAAASDSRLKQEALETPIAGLAEIMQLRPVAYKWLDDIENRGDDAAVELGFFADEAKDIIPSAAPMGNDGYYGFYDRAVIAALTKAVQEQQAIITALEARLTAANL